MLAPDLGCLASADWWLRHGTYQPPLAPDWVLQEATRDVLQVGRERRAPNRLLGSGRLALPCSRASLALLGPVPAL